MSLNLTRQQYCEIYGPTLGDQVRLGDTDLFIEVERDLITECGGYGNEVKFGTFRKPTFCKAQLLQSF